MREAIWHDNLDVNLTGSWSTIEGPRSHLVGSGADGSAPHSRADHGETMTGVIDRDTMR